jgi:hypothetical protein
MKTAEEFLNDKFNGKGYEFKIHDWINGQVSNYSPCELLEEYAQQNTLNRDKVMEVLDKALTIHQEHNVKDNVINLRIMGKKLATGKICSLSLPTLSEGEYTKIGKPDDCDVESCVGPDCEGCQRFQPKLITNALSEGEINPFPKSLYPDHHKAWEIGYKAAIKQLTKPKEER